MIDLLVHITTADKISPSGHVIKVHSKDGNNLLYKPNTPIGSLDVTTIYIVPKPAHEIPVRRMPRLPNQPFEQQTFRLQVNLPRNQRMVLRVSPRATLAEVKHIICHEKELDLWNHHLVHPAQPDSVLDLNSTLEDYGCAEISILSNSGLRDSIRHSSANFAAYSRTEEERKKKGILRLFSRRKKETLPDASINGLYSQSSMSSRTVSTKEISQSKQLSTKRKPAPAPPPTAASTTHSKPPASLVIQSSGSVNSRPESEEVSAKTDEIGSTVSHSRHSSDSSGYHEPSVFSDCSESKSPDASIVNCGNGLCSQNNILHKSVAESLSKCSCELSKNEAYSKSGSLSSASVVSRKRKAPLPPAPVLPEIDTPSSAEDLVCRSTISEREEEEKPTKVPPSDCKMMGSCWETAVTYDDHSVSGPTFQVQQCNSEPDTAYVKSEETTEVAPTLPYFVVNECETETDDGRCRSNDEDFLLTLRNDDHESTSEMEAQPCEFVPSTNADPSEFSSPVEFEEVADEKNETVIGDSSLPQCSISKDLDAGTHRPTKQNVPLHDDNDDDETVHEEHLSAKCYNANDPKKLVCDPPTVVTSSQERLVNFAMGCYKSEKDISSEKLRECGSETSNALGSVSDKSTTLQHSKLKGPTPTVKVVPFEERSLLEDVCTKGQVRQRCIELSYINSLPLTGRSASLLNLAPANNSTQAAVSSTASESAISRSDKPGDGNTSLKFNGKEFSQEHDHLKKEYLKLQAQFVSWQKQLLNNQYLLLQSDANDIKDQSPSKTDKSSKTKKLGDNPAVVPLCCSELNEFAKTASETNINDRIPSVEATSASSDKIDGREEDAMPMGSSFNKNENSEAVLLECGEICAEFDSMGVGKAQTLPRPVTQNSSAFTAPQTMTLNRRVRPKSQLISVTIGPWCQRNEVVSDIDSSAVASSRSKFQSLENIPFEQKQSSSKVLVGPKRSASNASSSKKESITSVDKKLPLNVAPVNKAAANPEQKDETVARANREQRSEKKAASLESNKSFNKPSKISVPVLSMKDHVQPPPLQALKKWPLPDMKADTLKTEKQRTVWEDFKATAKWSPWDRVTRAEVDLRKQRAEKRQATSKIKQDHAANKNKEELPVNVAEVEVHRVDEINVSNGSVIEIKSKGNTSASVNVPQKNSSSGSFNNELEQMLLSRRCVTIPNRENLASEEPAYAEAGDNVKSKEQKVSSNADNANIPEPPPPPPPLSTMPTIPPAAPIPKSSQLLIGNKGGTTNSKKLEPVQRKDPREELMLEIRGFGGRQALRKVPSRQAGWNMKFYGTLSTVNS